MTDAKKYERKPGIKWLQAQITRSAGIFCRRWSKQTALVCGYENNKCQDSLRKKEILHRKGHPDWVRNRLRKENKMSEEYKKQNNHSISKETDQNAMLGCAWKA